MRLLLILSFVLLPFYSQAVECVGFHEYVDKNNKAMVDSIPLVVEFESRDTLKLSNDIGDIHFMALGNKESDEYLLMVTLGPEYTSGVTAGLTWDKNNSMRISRVDQNTVYRLVCNK